MLFNSYEFILCFLPLTWLVYFLLSYKVSEKSAKYFLILASLLFYSYWDLSNLPILLVSIGINYAFGVLLSKKRSLLFLSFGVAFNILFLCYFKYTDFIISNINILMDSNIPLQNIVLPLGISFFTFTQTAYLVDVYRGGTNGYSKSDCLLFVTIFPHLISGPILYHKDMIPQFSDSSRYKINYENIYYGILVFTIGLLKKVIIADRLAVYANVVFDGASKLTMLDAWFGTLAYTLQLYFDFSGYSEMAIGIGLLFNYNLPVNFNFPYSATSIIDFWRRWHMTLSAFLKNYLYIPLGGNRTGHHLRNIFVTMFLGGLWHGAGWTFIFWGCLHGLFICINHLWRKLNYNMPKLLAWFLTFNVVNIAWIYFRANSIEKANSIIQTMFDLNSFMFPYSRSLAKYFDCFGNHDMQLIFNDGINILGCLLLSLICYNVDDIKKLKTKYVYGITIVIACVLAFSILNLNMESEFLYFQF